MPNPHFLQTAERWKNKNLPKEKTTRKPNSDSGLTQILERDKDGKPKLNLTPLEKTAVNTSTQKDYWNVIRVYECGGWKWKNGDLPTKFSYWDYLKKEICIGVGVDYYSSGKYDNGKVGWANIGYYQNEGWKVISTQEFYDTQSPKITQEMIKEINKWFEENGK